MPVLAFNAVAAEQGQLLAAKPIAQFKGQFRILAILGDQHRGSGHGGLPHSHALSFRVFQGGQSHIFYTPDVRAAHIGSGNIDHGAYGFHVSATHGGGELGKLLRQERRIKQLLVNEALDEPHALAPAILGEGKFHAAIPHGQIVSILGVYEGGHQALAHIADPVVGAGQGNFILNPVAIGIVITEMPQRIHKLVQCGRRFQTQLIQPGLVNHDAALAELVIGGFAIIGKRIDVAIIAGHVMQAVLNAHGAVFKGLCQVIHVPIVVFVQRQNHPRLAPGLQGLGIQAFRGDNDIRKVVASSGDHQAQFVDEVIIVDDMGEFQVDSGFFFNIKSHFVGFPILDHAGLGHHHGERNGFGSEWESRCFRCSCKRRSIRSQTQQQHSHHGKTHYPTDNLHRDASFFSAHGRIVPIPPHAFVAFIVEN